jgi:hypothetical protein
MNILILNNEVEKSSNDENPLAFVKQCTKALNYSKGMNVQGSSFQFTEEARAKKEILNFFNVIM